MTPDEPSLQELAARLASIEQENAELLKKLEHLSAKAATQEPEATLSLNEGAPLKPSEPPRKSVHQKSPTRPREPKPAGHRTRLASPLVAVGLTLLVLLLLGGSLGIYSLMPGHHPATGGPSLATTGATASPTQPQPVQTAVKEQIPPASLTFNPIKVNAQKGSLLIQSGDGLQCPYAQAGINDDLELGHLVLTSDQTTYSSDKIGQMKAYIQDYFGNGGVLLGPVLPDGKNPPPPLRWVLGGETTPLPGTPPPALLQSSPFPNMDCTAYISLTNMGHTPIQITKVGVQLQGRPQPNTYHYHLIDVCSIYDGYECSTPQGGGSGPCSLYAGLISLGLGQQHDIFSAVPTAGADCGVASIDPGAYLLFDLEFVPTPDLPQGLIYSIVPFFTIDTIQGGANVSLNVSVPELGKTMAFASASQFSCYGLQNGTTFVLERSPVFTRGSSYTSPNGEGDHWCL